MDTALESRHSTDTEMDAWNRNAKRPDVVTKTGHRSGVYTWWTGHSNGG